MAGLDTRAHAIDGLAVRQRNWTNPPPAGWAYLIQDSDGLTKIYKSDGTKITIGSGGGSSNATSPVDGTNLTNADATINPGTDAASRYTLPVATLGANHVLTLGTGGSPAANSTVEIVRRDLTANQYTINNGGLAAGTLVISAPSPAKAVSFFFQFDGANWQPINNMFAA